MRDCAILSSFQGRAEDSRRRAEQHGLPLGLVEPRERGTNLTDDPRVRTPCLTDVGAAENPLGAERVDEIGA